LRRDGFSSTPVCVVTPRLHALNEPFLLGPRGARLHW